MLALHLKGKHVFTESIEGMQAIVTVPTIRPLGSGDLRIQNWLREATQDVASMGSITG